MNFFADENISPRAAQLLEVFDQDCEIRSLEHFFKKGTPDNVWMREIAKWDPKPIVICGDGRILRNKVQRTVLRETDLMFVCLARGWTNLSWNEFAWKILKAWPSVKNNVSRVIRPTVFELKLKNLKMQHISYTSNI